MCPNCGRETTFCNCTAKGPADEIKRLESENAELKAQLAMARDALNESGIDIVIEGWRESNGVEWEPVKYWLEYAAMEKLSNALAATAPAVAKYEERLKREGAAEAANELAILRNARKVGEHYLRECIESRQSRDRQGNVTNSWAVVVIPDWQFRQMLYGVEPEARAAALDARNG